MNPSITTPAIVETILVTARGALSSSAKDNPLPHLPLPSEYLDVLVVFGILGLLPQRWSKVTTLIAWGFVVATGLNMAGAFSKLSAKSAGNTTQTGNAGSTNG